MFYPEGKKIIPINIISYMSPIVLAYLIMCDGYRYNNSVAIATNSFTVSDNLLLITALNSVLGLNSRLMKDHDQPSIFIPKSDLVKLQTLILPFMHPTLLYKIWL